MTFMPNTQTHDAAAAKINPNPADPNMGAIPQTNTANGVGGQVPVPNTSTQTGTTPPQALNDPSLGSNPGAANNGAGLTPVITATQFGTNNIPAFLNQGLNQLNSSFGQQQQWMDLIGKIVGSLGGQTQIATQIPRSSADDAAYWATKNRQQASDASQPSYGGGLWGTSTKRQLLDDSMFYQGLAHDVTPKQVTWNTGNTNYTTNQHVSGWGPAQPSY